MKVNKEMTEDEYYNFVDETNAILKPLIENKFGHIPTLRSYVESIISGYSDGFVKKELDEYSSNYADSLYREDAIQNTLDAIELFLIQNKGKQTYFHWYPEAEFWHDVVYIRMGLYCIKE